MRIIVTSGFVCVCGGVYVCVCVDAEVTEDWRRKERGRKGRGKVRERQIEHSGAPHHRSRVCRSRCTTTHCLARTGGIQLSVSPLRQQRERQEKGESDGRRGRINIRDACQSHQGRTIPNIASSLHLPFSLSVSFLVAHCERRCVAMKYGHCLSETDARDCERGGLLRGEARLTSHDCLSSRPFSHRAATSGTAGKRGRCTKYAELWCIATPVAKTRGRETEV